MLTREEELMRLRLQMAQNKDYLDITDVSILSGFSASLIRKRVKEHKLIAHQNTKFGKLLFKRVDVDRWLKGGREDV